MTLDFVRDLCDEIDKCGIEYVIFTFQNNKDSEVLMNSFESISDAIKPIAAEVLKKKSQSYSKQQNKK